MSFMCAAAQLLRVPMGVSSLVPRCAFGCSPAMLDSDAKWRRERKLPVCHTSFGPLTNLPDYTFADGRPTPLGSRQKKRVLQQRQYTERIVQLCSELDFARERLPRLQRDKQEKRDQLLGQRLKPKGFRLLQKAE